MVEPVEAEEGDGTGAGPEDVVIVAHARPAKGRRQRCGVCGRRCARFGNGEGRRRWRALDLGVVRAFIEADAPRVSCPEHGVAVARVPWARHGAGHTLAFDDTVAWLATHCSKTRSPSCCGSAGARSAASAPASGRTSNSAWTCSRA